MKKLSKILISSLLLLTLLFSVACGKDDMENTAVTIKNSLVNDGWDVSWVKNTSAYVSGGVLSGLGLKGEYYELAGKKQSYSEDTDFKFKKIVDGNLYAIAGEGDTAEYLYDAEQNIFRLAEEGEVATHVKNTVGLQDRYIPDEFGDYIFDEEAVAYVLDENERYFNINAGDYYAVEKEVDGEIVVEYVKCEANNTFVIDTYPVYVANEYADMLENGYVYYDVKGIFVSRARYSKKADGSGWEANNKATDTRPKYFLHGEDMTNDASYFLDPGREAGIYFEMKTRGTHIPSASGIAGAYDEDNTMHFTPVKNGNYYVKTNGTYALNQATGEMYEPTFYKEVNRTSSERALVSNVAGRINAEGSDVAVYRKYSDSDKYYEEPIERYVSDGNGGYEKAVTYVLDENGFPVNSEKYFTRGEGSGNLYFDGTDFVEDNRLKYVKEKDKDVYVLESTPRYIKSGESYVQFTEAYAKPAGKKYVADSNAKFIFFDGQYVEVNKYAYDADLYVPSETNAYVFKDTDTSNKAVGSTTQGAFITDADTHYALNEEGKYVKDYENGQYVKTENTIIVLVFEKDKDARTFYDKLMETLYNVHYNSINRDPETKACFGGCVSGRNGNIVYIGVSEDLDVLGDYRL